MHELYSVGEPAEELECAPRRARGRRMVILRGRRLGFTLRQVGERLDLYAPGSGRAMRRRAGASSATQVTGG